MANTPSNIDFGLSPVTDKNSPVVWLSVQNPKDRKIFKRFLPDFFTIESGEKGTEQDFDLCILDEQSLQTHKDKLQALKQEVAPVFLPVILLSQSKDKIQQYPHFLEFVDDVVFIPASSKLLQSRIYMLLKQREYSLKLEEKNRELEKKNDELAEEKKKYQLITENSTDMISRHTPDGTYLYASPASKELTGYTPEELIGQNAFANMHPEDRKVLTDDNSSFLAKSTVRWTFRKRTKSGDYKWVESTMKLINDKETGEVIEIQASTRDISARKKYEQKLEEEKEFIDTTIESLPGTFFMLDEELNFIKWNDNVNNKLGYGDREIEEMQPTDFFDDSEQQRIRTAINRIMAEGVADLEVRVKSKSGELIPFYIIGRRLQRGDYTYIVGTGIDITDRLAAEQKLRESQKRWENLVKNDPDLIQILEPDGTILFINPAGAGILGFDDPQEIIGRNYFNLVNLEDDKAKITQDRIQRVLDGEEVEPHIFKIQDYKGNLLYLESQAVPIKLDDGRIGLQQVAKDVTSRILYDRQLEQSLKEKKTLLQEIHHRVKNNLAVVSGMMDLQAFNTQNKELHNLLADSRNRIKTMALIHEKLYQSESLSQIDFASYVADLIDNIKEVSASAGEVEIQYEYDSFYLNVNQAVPCALIINEVIANAFEHAFKDRNHGTVRISLQQSDKIISITIQDNGRGLPKNFALKKQDSMGLTIIKTLIRQLNAEHRIENRDGLLFEFSFEKQDIKGSTSAFV